VERTHDEAVHEELQPMKKTYTGEVHEGIYWCMGLFLSRCRSLHFPLLNFKRASFSPFLQPVQVLLDDSMMIWHVSHSSQIDVVSKLAEGMLCPIIPIINEEVEKD